MQDRGAFPRVFHTMPSAHSFPRKMHVQGWQWSWEPIFIPWTFYPGHSPLLSQIRSAFHSWAPFPSCQDATPVSPGILTLCPQSQQPFHQQAPKNLLLKKFLLPLIPFLKEKYKERWVNAIMNQITTPHPKIILPWLTASGMKSLKGSQTIPNKSRKSH